MIELSRRQISFHLCRGFTLIEIIIVLLIISITAATVELNIGNRLSTSGLNQKTDEFHSLLLFASDYSLGHQQVLGLMLTPLNSSLVAFDERTQQWQPLNETAQYKIDADKTVHIFVESGAAADATQNLEGKQPSIIIYPDGSISPFILVFALESDPNVKRTLSLTDDGVIRMVSSEGNS